MAGWASSHACSLAPLPRTTSVQASRVDRAQLQPLPSGFPFRSLATPLPRPAPSISGHQAVLSDRAELLRVVEEAAAALVQDYPTPRRTVVLRAEEGERAEGGGGGGVAGIRPRG